MASGTSVRVRLWAREVAACCTRCLGPLHAWLYLNVRGFPETHHKVSQQPFHKFNTSPESHRKNIVMNSDQESKSNYTVVVSI